MNEVEVGGGDFVVTGAGGALGFDASEGVLNVMPALIALVVFSMKAGRIDPSATGGRNRHQPELVNTAHVRASRKATTAGAPTREPENQFVAKTTPILEEPKPDPIQEMQAVS